MFIAYANTNKKMNERQWSQKSHLGEVPST